MERGVKEGMVMIDGRIVESGRMSDLGEGLSEWRVSEPNGPEG